MSLPSSRGVCLALLLAFGCVLYLTNLGGWDLWPADEPRFGQVEREMLKSGDWLVPHVNNQVYTDKPPLFFWAGNAFALLNGGQVTSLTTRLPSALSGIASLIIAFFIGERLFNRRAAFLGALALGIAQLFLDQARTAQTDMIMAVFVFGAMAAFVSARFGGGLHPLAAAAGFGVFTGLAVLGKGPVGVIVPAGSILTFILFLPEPERIRRENGMKGWAKSVPAFLRRKSKRIRWGAVLVGALCFAAVLLPWLIPMSLSIPRGESKDLLWDQNVTRYLSATHHRNPPWFFLEYLPVNFLPVTLFLPAVALMLWREKRAGNPLSAQRLFLLCWFAFTFVFFSCSPGKREQYLLPLYPALALLVGDWMDRRIAASPKANPLLARTAWCLGALAIAAGVFAFTGARSVLIGRGAKIPGGAIPPEWFSLPSIAAGFVLGGLAILLATLGKNVTRIFYGIVAGTAIVWLTIFLFVYPPLNQRKSTRRFCETLGREWSPGETVFGYKLYREEYHLYGDWYIDLVEDFDPVFQAFKGPRQTFCLMRDNKAFEEFQKTAKTDGVPWRILWREGIGHRDVVLVTNRPAAAKPLDVSRAENVE